jgi:hypothetical protein
MGNINKYVGLFVALNALIPAFCLSQQNPDSLQGDSFVKTSISPNPNAIAKTILPVADTPAVAVAAAPRDTSFMQIDTKLKAAAIRLRQRTSEMHRFLAGGEFADDYCFMVDMSIPSGKKRFFVLNLKNDSVELASLVSHGSGSYKPNCQDVLTFSNAPNSNATSVGKYKIGVSYYGTYGLSYKLFGLDSSNNKAFERAVVLHSDSYVPDKETYPRHIYESAGCPIVSPSILNILGKYIKNSAKPLLLWIYN